MLYGDSIASSWRERRTHARLHMHRHVLLPVPAEQTAHTHWFQPARSNQTHLRPQLIQCDGDLVPPPPPLMLLLLVRFHIYWWANGPCEHIWMGASSSAARRFRTSARFSPA